MLTVVHLIIVLQLVEGLHFPVLDAAGGWSLTRCQFLDDVLGAGVLDVEGQQSLETLHHSDILQLEVILLALHVD